MRQLVINHIWENWERDCNDDALCALGGTKEYIGNINGECKWSDWKVNIKNQSFSIQATVVDAQLDSLLNSLTDVELLNFLETQVCQIAN